MITPIDVDILLKYRNNMYLNSLPIHIYNNIKKYETLNSKIQKTYSITYNYFTNYSSQRCSKEFPMD